MEIRLGNLRWQTTNLTTTKYLNGDEIQLITSQAEFKLFHKNKKPGYHFLDFDEGNKHLGFLYNIFAIKDKRGLFNNSYRAPTQEEWQQLFRIAGYLFNEDEPHLWDTSRQYNKERHKHNIEALKRLKSAKGWKKGHTGKNTTGFSALATIEESSARWLWQSEEKQLTGGVCFGNSSRHKKIEVTFSEHHEWGEPSEFIRLVKVVENPDCQPLKTPNINWMPGYLGYNLLNELTNFDVVRGGTQWGMYKQNKMPAKCFYDNASDGIPLFNYYGCKEIIHNLPREYKVPSSKDYQTLVESFSNNELHKLLDIYQWYLHFIREPNSEKKDVQFIYDIVAIGMRWVKYVTHWENEALYNYDYFSGKGNNASFWTSDDCVFTIKFEENVLKHEKYKIPKDSSFFGLGLPIKLIKNDFVA